MSGCGCAVAVWLGRWRCVVRRYRWGDGDQGVGANVDLAVTALYLNGCRDQW